MKPVAVERSAGFRALALILTMSAGWLFVLGRPSASSPSSDDWYSVKISGATAGYLHQRTERVTLAGTVRFRTLTESRMEVERLGARLEISSKDEYLETESGDLLEVASELSLSQVPLRSEARVEAGRVLLKSYPGGSAAAGERAIPFTGRLLGPEGIRRAAEKGLIKAGDRVSFQSFLSELSQVVRVTQTLERIEPIPGSPQSGEALRVTESYSTLPQRRTVWMDRSGRTMLASDESPFGELTTRLVTREEALAVSPGGGAVELPFREVMAKSNVRLPQARLLDSVTLRLERRTPAESADWPELGGPGQTVLEKAGGFLRLRVDRPRTAALRSITAGPVPRELEEFLVSNTYLNIRDEVLQKSAFQALGGENSERDPLRRALRLENWVSRHMRFDLGIALAPSSEVVRNLKGTCAEYAILLAALLRAAGIPSRFLMGYVYLDGVWGGHAWVEAHIGGKWLPLDAAVNGPGIADAARFALLRTSLNDGLGSLLGGGQSLMGNLEVAVESYSRGGIATAVDRRAPLHVVLGDHYLNGGLGLGLRKPRGFVFEETDRTWPDTTLLAMKGPRGEVIRVHQDTWRPGEDAREDAYLRLEGLVPGGRRSSGRFKGRDIPLVRAEGRAAAGVANGVDVWLIVAEGDDAEALLDFVLGSFSAGAPVPAPEREF